MDGIHELLARRIRDDIAKCEVQRDKAAITLQEAVELGDLSENSEYDAAKETMRRVVERLDILKSLSELPVLQVHDTDTLEEGCVASLKIYCVNRTPNPPGSSLLNYTKQKPIFEGTILFGGATPVHTLMKDGVLSTKTKIGSFLLGKQGGVYEVSVPGGFAIVEAHPLSLDEYKLEDIGCRYEG